MHRAAMLGGRVAGMFPAKMFEADAERVEAMTGAYDADVRYELVARLRKAIAAGTYRVAAADVAEKLMGTLR